MNPPASLPRLRSRDGFTLAELMATMVIFGILIAIAAPRMSGMLNVERTERALDGLASDIALARATAIRENRPVTVRVVNTTRYLVFVPGFTGTRRDTLRSVSLSDDFRGVRLSGPSTDVTFDSRGLLTSGGASFTATQSNQTRTLTVTGIGRVYRDY